MAMITITALQGQMIYSLLTYCRLHGTPGLTSRDYWNVKTGSWSGGVALSDVLDEKADSAV
jgi:hypothetical protein